MPPVATDSQVIAIVLRLRAAEQLRKDVSAQDIGQRALEKIITEEAVPSGLHELDERIMYGEGGCWARLYIRHLSSAYGIPIPSLKKTYADE